jgi:hypothetical protein
MQSPHKWLIVHKMHKVHKLEMRRHAYSQEKLPSKWALTRATWIAEDSRRDVQESEEEGVEEEVGQGL